MLPSVLVLPCCTSLNWFIFSQLLIFKSEYLEDSGLQKVLLFLRYMSSILTVIYVLSRIRIPVEGLAFTEL